MIRDMKEKGTNNREIAWDLGMSRNTVSKLLRTTRLTDHRQRKKGSKLDPYRDRIRALIDEHNLSAVRTLKRDYDLKRLEYRIKTYSRFRLMIVDEIGERMHYQQ